jgi:hypothetical protein
MALLSEMLLNVFTVIRVCYYLVISKFCMNYLSFIRLFLTLSL